MILPRRHRQSAVLWWWLWIYPAAMVLTGCQRGPSADTKNEVPSPPWQNLEARQPMLRLEAIKKAGESGDWRTVPLLVDRLQEDDIAVRMFASEALKRLTGKDYGYDYKASLRQRRQAVQRWREALNAGEHRPRVGTARR